MISKRNIFIIQMTIILSIIGLTISNLTSELQRAQNTIAIQSIANREVIIRAQNETDTYCISDIACILRAIDEVSEGRVINVEIAIGRGVTQTIYVSRRIPLADSAEGIASYSIVLILASLYFIGACLNHDWKSPVAAGPPTSRGPAGL